MTELDITLLSSAVGAVIGSALAAIGMLLNTWLIQRRERRQQIWRLEVDRIIALEERAGQLVELICSHRAAAAIRDESAELLIQMSRDAGRFLRHKKLADAVRDLHHTLTLILADKLTDRDTRENVTLATEQYRLLLKECDAITGKRSV